MKKSQMKFDVTGMTIEDISNIDPEDIGRMNRSSLQAIVSRLASAANKRLKRLKNSYLGEYSPAYSHAAGESGNRKFSVKGKNTNQLREEYVRARNFLHKKTSSVTGWKKVRKDIEKRVGFKIPKKKQKKFWRVFRKFMEVNRGAMGAIDSQKGKKGFGSDRFLKYLAKQYLGKKITNEDELLSLMQNEIKTIYKGLQKNEEQNKEEEIEIAAMYNGGFSLK